MTYLSGGPSIKRFQNEAGSCGEYSARGCQCSYPSTGTSKMNSYASIKAMFGSSTPDVPPPTVTITFPTEDAQVGDRELAEKNVPNGAVFTRSHVTRSARHLGRYLPTIGLGDWVPVSTRIVHFTGYEMPLDLIRVGDARDRLVGHLLGTADMLAQMADRCYLEKCRDRLYAEFVLGDVAARKAAGGVKVLYGSGLDLLRQTPQFVASTIDGRLGTMFGHAYRHVEPLFGGANPYMDAIKQNVEYLRGLARSSRWPMLRRNPPVFTVERNAMQGVRSLLVEHLKGVWGAPAPVSAN